MTLPSIAHSAPWLDETDLEAVSRCLASGLLTRGANVEAFQAELALALDRPSVLATASGSAAIQLALLALDIGAGDEVVLPTYVCASVRDAVSRTGATPVLCDIGSAWTMTRATVEPVLSPKTRALIVVHLFGIDAGSTSFTDLGLPIIEDCCQALGHRADGGIIGGTGTFVTLSFHPTKCLTAAGGGAIAARTEAHTAALRRIIAERPELGTFSDVQAALGRSQWRRYAHWEARRRVIAERYLRELPAAACERLRGVRDRSMFFRFPLDTAAEVNTTLQAFAAAGINARRGVDALLHREAGLSDAAFAGAAATFHRTVSLPIRPQLTDADVDRIVHVARRIFGAE